MNHPTPLPLGDSLQESQSPSLPSHSSGSATHIVRKPPPLRIIVPPTEYCPFSTDLTLPITPLSLPTPVASSCFTFNDTQDPASQSVSVTPTSLAGPVLSSCTRETAVTDFASPTSSQFLLMPPTPHLENVETILCVSPVATPHATIQPIPNGSESAKSANLRPWEVSSSTWLTDLGGYTETDYIFRQNLLEMSSTDSDSSPVSTPALSPSAVSPSSLVSSVLATTLARSPASLPLALSPCTMSPPSSLPARLVLKPTGTDTFPSMLDSLQAWRENVTFGSPPPEEEPRSPFSEDAHYSQTGEAIPETAIYADVPPLHPRRVSTRVPHVSRSRTFIKHAKRFGGRVKQLVTRRNINEYHGSMDRGVSFRVVTSQDSENGSVILITAPPPPYDNHSLLHIGPAGQDYVRPRTTSEYSSAVQTSTAEVGSSGMLESDTRRGGNRNTLRRFSFAALSTIKRL
ncbi:hypothetical protein JVU11DRAFT_5205 [Chiua virens]|nr:hypothetical protein JVU11DRAFT_5205 [Chiua virens]